ncbi:MAG: hypothetical protein JJ891_02010 [Rhizobiaceae bacterium]|nr:hypothetical protein [Rhizobiaceae bacterium]
MIHSRTAYRAPAGDFPSRNSIDFDRRVREGLRNAPEERAKAIKEFWQWVVRGFH